MRLNFLTSTLVALCLQGLSAAAQDVTLTSRDGSLSVEGSLVAYDGEFYRINSSYGLLTIDGEGVVCDGPACPDLTAPFAAIRLLGAPEAGETLLLPLWQAFAKQQGFTAELEQDEKGGFLLDLSDAAGGRAIGRVTFLPAPAPAARKALAEAQAELVLTYRSEQGASERVAALDALVPIVSPGNPVAKISTADLAKALTGVVQNWAELGGPDMPIVLHSMAVDASLQEALEERLGSPVAASEIHLDQAALAQAVAHDPYALAITAQSAVGAARALPLTDSCGFPLEPTKNAVKAGDYPLSLPVYLQTPRRRLPLLAREFLEFLNSPEAQAVVAGAGFTDKAPERHPLTEDGLRLMNAILATGKETGLEDLKRMTGIMAGADRLSLTFRFEDGSATLDAASQDNLAHLAKLLAIGTYQNYDLILAGFSDGQGAAKDNLELSQQRAEVVAAALKVAAPDMPESQRPPRIEAFGEALPMACDSTTGGRRLNRRVELWLRPVIPAQPGSDESLLP